MCIDDSVKKEAVGATARDLTPTAPPTDGASLTCAARLAAGAPGSATTGADPDPVPVCRIVGAGEGFPAFAPLGCRAPGDLLIAADGGLTALQRRGLAPDVLLGDFDSLGYCPDGEDVLCYPVMKDDTDMMLAIRLGLEKGYRRFYLYGGTGGRLDHTLANLQALGFLAAHGAVGFLFEAQQTLTWLQDGSARFAPQPEGLLSVFAPGGPACGVDLCGLQYPLQGATLSPTVPLGVSNHFTGQAATVTVRHGALLLAWDRPCLPRVEQGTAQPPARCPNTDPGRDSR